MSKRKEDDLSASAEQKRARPGENVDEDVEIVSDESSSAQSGSEEGGIIQSIQVENFMGYTRLGPVEFGANVNFVVGQNGKNAVLTALIVGLGGKSLGSPLQEFVKEGEASATISITLRNRGDDAFKSEVYGDSITVHRHINVDGSSSYEIKGQTGKLVSSQKDDLFAILDHFKIQVDNPLSVLPQRLSRQLLRLKNESDRYRVFMEATELEQMREGYSKILERKARSQEEIIQGEEQLEQLRRQGVEIEDHFQTMLALDQKLQHLKHEKTWSLVSETERTISNMINDINIEDQHTALLSQDLEASRVTYNETLQRYMAIQENVVKLNEEAAELEPKCLEAKEIAKRTDRAYRQATAFYNYSQNELIKLDRVSEELHERIIELRRSLELAEAEKQRKIAILKERVNNFKAQEDSLVREIKYLHQSIEKDDEEHSRVREEEAFVQDMLNEDQEHLNHLRSFQSNPLKRFGPQIPDLIEAIDDAYKQGYFTQKPLGPLGACIRLRYPEYALAIESCLKGLLIDFLCDNSKDEQVLSELLKRFYPANCADRPQIMVAAFDCELQDVTARAASHPDYPTVLSALEIDEAVVANTLIDLRGIESVLLIESGSLASMHAQGRPKNCNKILTAYGDQVFEGRYYNSCEDLRPVYLGDIEREICQLEREVEIKTAKLAEFQQHILSLQTDIRRNRQTIDSHYQQLREVKAKVLNTSSEIRDLEDEEENQSIDLSVLEDEAEEIKEEIKGVEEKMRTRKEKMDNLKQPKLDAEQRHQEFKLQCSRVSELVESLMEERNQAGLEVSAQHQTVMHHQKRLKQHVDSVQVRKDRLAMKERKLEREMAEAHYVCPERIEVTRTADVLDKEIIMVTQRIRSENYTHRRREDITRQYQDAKERYLDLNGRVNNLKTLIETLDEILAQRYATYQKSRRNLSLQCKLLFDSLLSRWSLTGEMRFNHRNETLSITVQPAGANENDMENLTVNRHSFSNFLLILTLWSVTEAPFRCVDTVDVYMDRKNRKTAMEMILWVSANSYPNHQIIVFSPHLLSTFPSSPLVEIFKIPDAESDGNVQPLRPVDPNEED